MAPINADPAIAADRAAIAISTWLSPKILPEEKPPPIFSKPPKRNDRSKKYIKVAKKQTMGGKAARAAAPSPFAPPKTSPVSLSGDKYRTGLNTMKMCGKITARDVSESAQPNLALQAGAPGRGIEARQVFGKKYGGRRASYGAELRDTF